MKALRLVSVAMLTILLTGCGGSLTDLAEGILYPFEQTDKKYPVPELPPEGLGQIYFSLQASDDSDMQVHAWFYKSPNPRARTLIHFHGNGENLETLRLSGFIDVLRQLEFNFIIIDYPGQGRSTGFPDQPNLVNAGHSALVWARQTFPQAPLIVWGRSLGAAVATQVAANDKVGLQGLVLTSPWSSFLELALDKTGLAGRLPKEWLEKHGWDSAAAAVNVRVSTLIHHGTKDGVIPIKFGKRLLEAFPSGVAEFVELDGFEHNDIYRARELWNDLKNFKARQAPNQLAAADR